jgi:hypothetical protein
MAFIAGERHDGLLTGDGSSYIARNAEAFIREGLAPPNGCVQKEDSMLRWIPLLLALPLVLDPSGALAQTKKPSAQVKSPTANDHAISVNVFLRDDKKDEILLGTRIWPGYPDYNAIALQRFFAVMKALEPAYKQDDEVAYSWATKAKVTKCAIYLESADAGAKNGTGATVGCEANGVSNIAVTAEADPKHGISASSDPKHLNDVMDLFNKQSERARNSLAKH